MSYQQSNTTTTHRSNSDDAKYINLKYEISDKHNTTCAVHTECMQFQTSEHSNIATTTQSTQPKEILKPLRN